MFTLIGKLFILLQFNRFAIFYKCKFCCSLKLLDQVGNSSNGLLHVGSPTPLQSHHGSTLPIHHTSHTSRHTSPHLSALPTHKGSLHHQPGSVQPQLGSHRVPIPSNEPGGSPLQSAILSQQGQRIPLYPPTSSYTPNPYPVILQQQPPAVQQQQQQQQQQLHLDVPVLPPISSLKYNMKETKPKHYFLIFLTFSFTYIFAIDVLNLCYFKL